MASVGAGGATLLATGELIAEVALVAVGEAGGLEDVGERLRKLEVVTGWADMVGCGLFDGLIGER